MKNLKIEELFQEAEKDFHRSKKELYRPMEDVVTYTACVSSRRALYKYLLGLSLIHAKENNESIDDNNTIEKLIKYNSKYSDELNNIDFSALNCRCEDMSEQEEEQLYCASVDKVNYCSNLSESVRNILIEKEPSLLKN
ncbi:hypothetical protein ACKGJO_02015 [Gracilimonas sp. Q87]|uniref:hypothetical protein n=1 Tax=Gracilimonas sp. Q87 TaxID=3384766 RepID=UPI00398411F9